MNSLQKFLFIPFTLLVLSGFAQDTIESYLHNNAVNLTSHDLDNSKTINNSFNNYQLFLVGEIHGIKSGQDVDFTLLTYLNHKLKVKTYVAEFDFAKAYLLNKYLQTGNENLIDSVFRDWAREDAQWANTDFQEKIRKIRIYNQSLNPLQKIHFEGIDQIQNPLLVADYLKELLSEKQYNDVNKLFNPLIHALEAKNDSLIISTSADLLDTLRKVKKLNGNKADDLLFAVKNCTQVRASREAVMYSNFKELFKLRNWEKEKLYGFFGFFHILQSKANGGKSSALANRLQNDKELTLRGKILSIGVLYIDSKMTTPNSALPEAWQQKGKRYATINQYNHDGPLVRLDGIEDFKKVTKPNTITLFNLITPGSPYLNKSLDIHYADIVPESQRLQMNESGKHITDYFQYVILVRNSEPTNPIIP
jgi:hypothetical protein